METINSIFQCLQTSGAEQSSWQVKSAAPGDQGTNEQIPSVFQHDGPIPATPTSKKAIV
ncbi:UNVERIFIED_CONTAM: hypothetical protein Slati_1376700 [Sesamum latifolium]|uniref:Uncharacterized protein n=1 Tax=Sesamum latifolium TaxID=2727402 RepID=A0AAW2XP46_9LAMI